MPCCGRKIHMYGNCRLYGHVMVLWSGGPVFFGASVLPSEDIRRTEPTLSLAPAKVLRDVSVRKMFPQACMPFAPSEKSPRRPAKHFRRPKKLSAGVHAF